MRIASCDARKLLQAFLTYKTPVWLFVAYVFCEVFAISSFSLAQSVVRLAAATLPMAAASENAPEELIWLQNDRLKVGLNPSSGGAIAWISEAGFDRSLVNSFDRGRLVQQSWYGKEDGSFWNKTPWRWNPVQGGDWKGKSAVVLEQKHEPTTSYVKSQPLHWATGELLTDCTMEQTLTLVDDLLHIKYRFLYSGTESHPARHQELPAFFVDGQLSTLVFYDGDAPWTNGPLTRAQPGFPNEYKKITEHWAVYVGDDDRGIGCYVPVANEMTCYRYGKDSRKTDSCSYLAPIRTIAVTPGFQWEYDVWITIGNIEQIRDRFQSLSRKQSKPDSARP